jgi:D-cysteine desulfhydrase
MRKRLHLVHGPTPIERFEPHGGAFALSEVELWIKRDDMTGGACAGNKIRKLEHLLAHAKEREANHVITCGGLQSNHARATALLAAQLGMRSTLLLRTEDFGAERRSLRSPSAAHPVGGTDVNLPVTGNVLLDRLAGAEIRLITPAEYAEREAHMSTVAAEIAALGGKPYVIPEGGSNGLGALGYVDAMHEVKTQLDAGLGGRKPFDVIVHACGSGGTSAGIALGARRWEVAERVRSVVVCDDANHFRNVVEKIVRQAMAHGDLDAGPAAIDFDENARGPRYGVMSDEQRAFLVRVARASGLVLDPVYTGKAFFGLDAAVERGEIPRGSRVLFVHTGGLPGLLAAGDAFAGEL